MAKIDTPEELRNADDGKYSLHFCGEASGVSLPWDEKTYASALLEADLLEVAGAGGDGHPDMSVQIIEVKGGDCFLIDEDEVDAD